MDRTSAQPQVNLSLLLSKSLKFQPLDCGGGEGVIGPSTMYSVRMNRYLTTTLWKDLNQGYSTFSYTVEHQVLPRRGFELMSS
jgi:hypothetical protein